MSLTQATLIGSILRFAKGLRFPVLFLVTAGLFVVDLFVPEPVPFVDELILGLATLLLASWKRRRRPAESDDKQVIEVEPSEPAS